MTETETIEQTTAEQPKVMDEKSFTERPFAKNEAREAAQMIAVGPRGILPTNFAQLVDRATLMAADRVGIPRHLRGNRGACVTVIEMAMNFGFSFNALALKTYVVNDMLALDAQTYMACLDVRAESIGLKSKPISRYEGEGLDRQCIVTGQYRNELEPRIYRSPPIKQISPRNSPLWTSDPDRQLHYYSMRAWIRMHAPRVMLEMGIPPVDETQDYVPIGPEAARLVNPETETEAIRQRLAESAEHASGDGFQPEMDVGIAEAIQRATEAGVAREKIIQTLELTADLTESAAEADAEAETKTSPARKKKAKPQAPEKTKVSRETPVEKVPGNATDYAVYVKRWLRDAKTAQEVADRWRNERALRNRCGVTAEDRIPLEDLKDKRAKALG